MKTKNRFIAELGGRRPPSGAPYPYKGTKGNPWIDFLMCIMASGIARGRVRTTTTTVESRNMAAMLQLMG